jgi:hypothetical protein
MESLLAHYAVTYDLVKNKDYKRLIDELTEMEAHRPALSVWFLDWPGDAESLLAHLRAFIDDDDKLIVIRFDWRPATRKPFEGTKAWLDARF